MKLWLSAALLLSLGVAANTGEAYVGAPVPGGTFGGDLSTPARTKVVAGLAAASRAKLDEARSPNALAMDALLAAEGLRRGDQRFASLLRGATDLLQRSAVPVENGLAWGRGTVQRPSPTVYSFQSGLAIAALARAAEVTKHGELLDAAEASARYWRFRAVVPPDCPNCIYFPSGAGPGEVSRLVRNMNVLMGLGEAAIASASRSSFDYSDRVVAAELAERRAENRGYLSRFEPLWRERHGEADRIENHAIAVALGLLGIFRLSGNKDALDLAVWNFVSWAECRNTRCTENSCSYWGGDPSRCTETATFAHCAFRQQVAAARERCERAIELTKSLNRAALLFIIVGDA